MGFFLYGVYGFRAWESVASGGGCRAIRVIVVHLGLELVNTVCRKCVSVLFALQSYNFIFETHSFLCIFFCCRAKKVVLPPVFVRVCYILDVAADAWLRGEPCCDRRGVDLRRRAFDAGVTVWGEVMIAFDT